MDIVQRVRTLGHSQATGLRKLTPPMLATITSAEAYCLTDRLSQGQVLAAFKAAAPYLGLRATVVHTVDWLFRFTDAIDWQPGARPIVWPSATMQQQALGLGPSQVKNINRHLVELGLVVMRDSPNGKRYGRRSPDGRIVEAYGFDLSPLARRFAEFQAIAQAGREERSRLQALRRRASVARNGLRQLRQAAQDAAIAGPDWDALCERAATASRHISGAPSADAAQSLVGALEQALASLQSYLQQQMTPVDAAEQDTAARLVDNDPKEPENWPHITDTNQLRYLKDTVIAHKNGAHAATVSPHPQAAPRSNHRPQQHLPAENTEADIRVTPTELTRLAPRLRTYLRRATPGWPDIVEAADWLREEMGISRMSWGEACVTMGREAAAVTVAILSTRPQAYFRQNPGAYFHGMIFKARTGELHLGRTLWRLRGQGGTQPLVS